MDKYVILHIEGGIGKNIVGTSIVRAIKNTYSDRKTVVVTPYPEVFIHNPNVYRVYKIGNCPYFYEDYIKDKDTIVVKHEPYYSNDVINKRTNLSLAWCNSNNLTYSGNLPDIYFNVIEQQNAQLLFKKYSNGKPIIALQSNGGMGSSADNPLGFNWYRDVPVDYFQDIIKKYSEKFTFLQIRSQNQPALSNVVSPELSTRELLLLLSMCSGAVCIDSLTQHVMAAFNKKSAVLWVGNSPIVYGYDNNINIISSYEHVLDNPESYLEPYPLQTRGHQCPSNYNPYKLFDREVIDNSFKMLFSS